MNTITTYPWGTVLRTRVEDKQALIDKAFDLMMDYLDSNEWDDVPTQQPISIATGIFNEWGYHGWAEDSRHRTAPRARKNRATK